MFAAHLCATPCSFLWFKYTIDEIICQAFFTSFYFFVNNTYPPRKPFINYHQYCFVFSTFSFVFLSFFQVLIS